MAKKAKKKSVVSRAVRTVKKAVAADPKSREKGDAGKEGQEEVLPALIQTEDASPLVRFFPSANAMDVKYKQTSRA